METKQEEIIRKIQKLFRLAEKAGCDAEAQAAAFRARELLGKYNLSLQDVECFTDEECKEASFVIKKSYIPSYTKIFMATVCTLFQCHSIITRNYQSSMNLQKIVFIGIGADAIIAAQTYDYLVCYGKNQAKKRQYTEKQTNDYLYGFALSVLDRAREMKKKLQDIPQENALVPLKDSAILEYKRRHFEGLTKRRFLRERGMSPSGWQGYDDGKRVNLDRAVDAASPASLSQ